MCIFALSKVVNMKYKEYLSCAEKHLRGCSSLLMSYKPDSTHDRHVWLELYYLSGYIVEGITVYSAYKLNGWPSNDDIKRCYNESFTHQTGLDFYYKRTDGERSVFPNRNIRSLSVQGHRFQDIAKNLLKINPSFNDVPYIGMGDIDPDIEYLIDNWRPEIRYKYIGANDPFPQLNQDVIYRLINTCRIIYAKHI